MNTSKHPFYGCTRLKEEIMKKISIVVILVIMFGIVGCASMSDTEKRTLGGGAIGAGTGTLIGAIAGHTGWGAAIGAAAGLAGGFIYDQHEKSKEKSWEEGYKAGRSSSK
jgi:hypothetical protein